MSILTLASAQSVWRGYEYFVAKNVILSSEISNCEIKGFVRGSNGARYEVLIDLEHPRKSKCTCPHAQDKSIICKHKVALYFHSFPEEAAAYHEQMLSNMREEEDRQKEENDKLIRYIGSLKKSELQELVLDLLMSGPEWLYESFIDTYID